MRVSVCVRACIVVGVRMFLLVGYLLAYVSSVCGCAAAVAAPAPRR